MFKLDSPLMSFLNKVADIMILNFLFIVFSIPFFTIGASFSAAYYMSYKMVRNEETYIVKGFWKAFKENFKQGTVIWLILLVIFGILLADYRILAYSGIEFAQWMQIAMTMVTIVVLMGVVFIFPLQARFINPVKNTIKNAFLMALSHMPTAFLLAVYAVPVIILFLFPQALPVLILMTFGVVFYVKAKLLLRVFKKYEEAIIAASKEASGEEDDQDGDSGIFAESDRIERENKMVKVFRNGKFVEVPESSLNSDTNKQK